jgi:hypothetical protein
MDRADSFTDGPVAQRLEQGTHNPLVGGSNPSGPTIINPSMSNKLINLREATILRPFDSLP